VVRPAFDILALFSARASGILVTLLFLPIYARRLSAADFGVVAIVLTLQAMIQIADLGMGTTLARETAREMAVGMARRHRTRRLLLVAERLLWAVYAVAAVLVLAWWSDSAPLTAGLTVCFALFFVLHHVFQSALIATQKYALASGAQALGALGRAALTAWALIYVEPTARAFLVVQTGALAAHYAWTRRLTLTALARDARAALPLSRRHLRYVLKESLPFLVLGGAGAAAANCDKPIIAALISPVALSGYFLAFTYSQVPLAVLSSPLAQYFQPRITSALAMTPPASAIRHSRQFASCLVFTLVGPVTLLAVFAPEFTRIWLRGAAQTPEVVRLIPYLLPGTFFMAFSFVPYVLLTVGGGSRFMATYVLALTALVVPGFAIAATWRGVEGVALTLLGYQVISSVGLWWRAAFLPITAPCARAGLSTLVRSVSALVPWCLAMLAVAAYTRRWSIAFVSGNAVLGCAYGGLAFVMIRRLVSRPPAAEPR
jgi:O-antigen/teichoic acid export membrane protein